MIHDFEIGDIVLNDFDVDGVRETSEGVVTEIDEETCKYHVAQLIKEKTGYLKTGLSEWRTAGMLGSTGNRIEKPETLNTK